MRNPVQWYLSIFARFRLYHSDGRSVFRVAGIVGLIAYPLFYLLRFTKSEMPVYDDWPVRLIAFLLCLLLALKTYWPSFLKPYYIAYAYLGVLYCFPFFFVFTSLKSGGGVIAVANTFMGMFLLVFLTDWRNTIMMSIVGMSLGAAAYFLTTPDPTVPMDYVARLPLLILSLVGGSVLKYSDGQLEAMRMRAMASLAGSIAHEMRNPLSQIKFSLDSIGHALPPPTTGKQVPPLTPEGLGTLYSHLAQGQVAIKRGLQVISMTLDGVQDKPISAHHTAYFSAAQATFKAVEEFGYETAHERDKVSVTVLNDFTFRGEETAYIFIIFNLLKNALFYLKTHATAIVAITIDGDTVRVKDTGPGIGPAALARLFGPFQTMDKEGGTGLGLAYCKRVMTAFGGDIKCVSEPGKFTEFKLKFPSLLPGELTAYNARMLAQAAPLLAGRRVLVVDDSSSMRRSTCRKLETLGCVLYEAEDGEMALRMLGEDDYDLVLMDLNMPVMDGYAAAERIRSGVLMRNVHVPIVAHTSESAYVASVKTAKVGMNGFVGKPCSQVELVMTLAEAVALSRDREERALPAAGKTILVVEDSGYARAMLRAYLLQLGASVIEAGDGRAALAQLRAHERVDAVVMDIHMPGMDGMQTARAIRDRPWRHQNVPVIALTGDSGDAKAAMALAAGMGDFLTKPVQIDVLSALLARVFGREPVTAP